MRSAACRVLRDPGTDRILAIWNPVSGRAVGDSSLLSELDGLRAADRDVFGPYPKTLSDGRRMSSVSVVLRDARGRSEGVLCINIDRTVFDDAARVLSAFAASTQGRPASLFERDWTEIVGGCVRDTGVAIHRFTRADRRTILGRLEAAGVLSRQRSIPVVAQTLGASRATIYQLRAEIRQEPTTDADAS